MRRSKDRQRGVLGALANRLDPEYEALLEDVFEILVERHPELKKTGRITMALVEEEIARLELELARLKADDAGTDRRIGELLGEAENGGDRRRDQFRRDGTDLSRHERHDFRKMAANTDVVQQVIADSTDGEALAVEAPVGYPAEPLPAPEPAPPRSSTGRTWAEAANPPVDTPRVDTHFEPDPRWPTSGSLFAEKWNDDRFRGTFHGS